MKGVLGGGIAEVGRVADVEIAVVATAVVGIGAAVTEVATVVEAIEEVSVETGEVSGGIAGATEGTEEALAVIEVDLAIAEVSADHLEVVSVAVQDLALRGWEVVSEEVVSIRLDS